MKKLITIPTFNESVTIQNTIMSINSSINDFDSVVIDNCSIDQTLQILKDNHYNYIDLPIYLGIGGVVQNGYRYEYINGYDIAVQVYVDGQHNIIYLHDLLDCMNESDADKVVGSRVIRNDGFQSSFMRRVGITYFTKIIRSLTGVTITDPTSGFRMINEKVISLFASDYTRDYPESESVVNLLKFGYKVKEVPVKMKELQGGKSFIKMKDSIYCMIKVTLGIFVEYIRKHGDRV